MPTVNDELTFITACIFMLIIIISSDTDTDIYRVLFRLALRYKSVLFERVCRRKCRMRGSAIHKLTFKSNETAVCGMIGYVRIC